jgi:hypothetical protein
MFCDGLSDRTKTDGGGVNKVVANFEKHIFLSQTDLTRTGIISNSYNEMFKA